MTTPDSAPETTAGSAPGDDQLVSPALMELIVCPDCHGDLVLSAGTAPGSGELTCQRCGLVYPVRDGIPVLLVDEARRPA